MTTMPDGRSLPAANYRDVVRPLRRMLKQMGQGCLTAGGLVDTWCSNSTAGWCAANYEGSQGSSHVNMNTIASSLLA